MQPEGGDDVVAMVDQEAPLDHRVLDLRTPTSQGHLQVGAPGGGVALIA